MRIAYDVASLLGPRTGVGHYAASLLKALQILDPTIEITGFAVTSKTGPSDELKELTVKRIRLPGRIGVTAWTSLGTPPAENWFGEMDVVHGTNFWIPPLQKRRGVVTIHDLTFLLYPELCTPHIQRYRRIVPKVLKSCELVLVPSDTVRKEVSQELSFPEDRIVVTPEGVRGTFAAPPETTNVLESLGVTGPYVVFAGTQEPRKNLDRLIQAMSLLAKDLDVQLVIAGPPGWGSADLEAVVAKLHLGKRVIFTGYLTDDKLASLISGARAFVFPSLYEGFGLPPLEAMAASVPVVAARAGSLPEVLGDVPFWCDPLDIASIASAMYSAISDVRAREASIEAGLVRAASFTWDRTASLTRDAYAHVSLL